MIFIKKGLTLLITILMLLVAVPCSIVFAEDEEGPLGKKSNLEELMIVYSCQDNNKDNDLIISYQYFNSQFTTKYYTYDYNNFEEMVEIEEVNLSTKQKEKLNDFNSKVQITYDDGIVDGDECFTINVLKGKELNLYGFIDDKFNSLISCTCNLKIVGKGTINTNLVTKPENVSRVDKPTFNSASMLSDYMVIIDGKLSVGDDNSSLTMKLDTSDEGRLNRGLDGIKALEIKIKNTNLTINVKTRAFAFEENEFEPESDQLLIEDSKVSYSNKIFGLRDDDPRECALAKTISNTSANITVKNSTLNININDPTENKSLIKEGNVIELNTDTNSEFNLINSKLDFQTNARVCFCSANIINIENCKKVTCIQNDLAPLFTVRNFTIKNSNFNFESAEQMFCVVAPPEFTVSNDISQPSFEIIEESDSYSGKMKIRKLVEEESGLLGLGDSVEKYIFPRATDPLASRVSNDANIPFNTITITTKGNNVLKTYSADNKLEKNANLSHEGNIHTFYFENGKEGNTPDKIAWRYFELSTTKKDNSSPRHEVLNTGVY